MSSQRHIIEMSCDDIFDFQDFEAVKFKIIGQSFLYNQIRKMIGMIIDLMRFGILSYRSTVSLVKYPSA